jgi:serine/threonine protein kinase
VSDRINHRLGDFEIVRELGRGGMGIVYEARQLSLNRRVALKVLSGGLGLTPKAVQRFRREAEAAAKLHHTNIVPVYATGEADGTHFYAMELIDGPSLDHVIRQMRQVPASGGRQPPYSESRQGAGAPRSAELLQTGPYVGDANSPGTATGLTSSSLGSGSGYFDTVARMIAEVADALDYAHKEGVIHRDIKPSNLLLSPAGRLSINDFGLARMLEQPGMTMTGEFVGTPAYMSPEQITAGRTPLDHRTDIYSLGATLYELLTLQPPFAGTRRDQVLAQILHKDPKGLRKLNAKVPLDLETICLKAMEKDPDRRYQTAGALADDLRRYINRFAISARRAGPITKLKKWAKRSPALAAACLVALLALGTTGLFAYWSYRGEQERLTQQQKHEEELQKQEAELQTERRERAFDDALTEALSGIPDRAEKAFRAAESVGVSADRIRLLRGLVALQRDDLINAIPDLELAVQRMPDSFAARDLLRLAYARVGRVNDYQRMQKELRPLDPTKPEDHIVRALYIPSDTRILKDLDALIDKRDSLIARTLRAQMRAILAQEASDPKEAEKAIQEIQPIRLLLPDNLLVVRTSLYAHLLGGFLHGEQGNKDRQQVLYKQAEKDARALRGSRNLSSSFYLDSLLRYYRIIGDEASRTELFQQAIKNSTAENILPALLLSHLYEQGEYKKALEIINKKYWRPPFVAACKIYLLAETKGPTEAHKACPKMDGDDLLLQPTIMPLIFLGRTQEAREQLRQFRKAGKLTKPSNAMRAKWLEAEVAYLCEEISETEYLKEVSNSRRARGWAQWVVGVMHLAAGDRKGAREHFQKSSDLGPFGEFPLCRGMLKHLEQDPSWPPWIPVKK